MAYVLNPRHHGRHGCCGCGQYGNCGHYGNCGNCRNCGCGCGGATCPDDPCGCENAPRPPRGVIYAGPCPPDPECPCQPPLPPPPIDPPCYRPPESPRAYAYYAQNGSLVTTIANAAIPLDTIMHESASFVKSDDVICVRRPGTYLASFTLNIPAQSAVNTQISLTLDGTVVPGSILNITKAPGAAASYSFQAVFTVYNAGARLILRSSSPLNLQAPSAANTIASLILSQLS